MRFAEGNVFLGFILLSTLLVFSCKKKDEIPPQVNFISPNSGQVYNVFDTVVTRFSATDDQGLEYVFAKIVDENFIPIGSSTPVNISSTTNQGSADLIIDDKLLQTGDYFVLAVASDGVNETREFREIRIVALPKKRRSIYFSTFGQSDQIWKVDSLFQNGSVWLSPSQDVLKLSVNSIDDRLNVVGYLSTGIKNFDLTNSTLVWSDNAAVVNQIQRYTNVVCFENTVYASLYDRMLRSYDPSGALTLNEEMGNFRPGAIYADQNYLVVGAEEIGGNTHQLFVYNRMTKALLWQQQIPINVKAICALQNDEVLLFGNNGNQARVLHYDIGDNGYWEPRQLPAGRMYDAVKMEGLSFAFSHQNGLYSYTYNPNFLNQIGTMLYQDLCFDVDNATLLGASQNMVEEIDPASGTTLNSFAQSDSITSVDIHYTR